MASVNAFDTLRRPSEYSSLIEEPLWAYAVQSETDPNTYTVRSVIVIDWNTIANRGQFWANAVAPGTSGIWIETSYSGAYRGYYAGQGYSYSPNTDLFYPVGAAAPTNPSNLKTSASVLLVSYGGGSVFGGTAGADNLVGTPGSDSINGFDGADTIDGGPGADTIRGEAGNDCILGGSGDSIDAGEGDDVVLYAAGVAAVDGGPGTDRLYLGSVNDFDLSQAQISNVEIIEGGAGPSVIRYGITGTYPSAAAIGLIASPTGSTLVGGSNADTFVGGPGNDLFDADDRDSIIGGGGRDTARFGVTVSGAQLSDSDLQGVSNIEVIGSGPTFDFYSQSESLLINGSSIIVGVPQFIRGGSGADTIIGPQANISPAAHTLIGGAGSDCIWGGAAPDLIIGETGNDTLIGGSGAGDTVSYAGNRADYAIALLSSSDSVYQISSQAEGVDIVSGFEFLKFDDTVLSIEATPVSISLTLNNDVYNVTRSNLTVNAGAGDDLIWVNNASNVVINAGAGNDDIQPYKNSGQGNTLITGVSVDGGEGIDRFNLSFLGESRANLIDVSSWRATGLIGNDAGEKFWVKDVESIMYETSQAATVVASGAWESFYGNRGSNGVEGSGQGLSVVYPKAASSYSIEQNGIDFQIRDLAVPAQSNGRAESSSILRGVRNVTFSDGSGIHTGRDSADTIAGGDVNDTMFGLGGADLMEGGRGNDKIEGGVGNDTLRGGEGSDTVGYVGNRADYAIALLSSSDSVYQISSQAEGVDVVTGFEFIRFADTTIGMQQALGFDGNPTPDPGVWSATAQDLIHNDVSMTKLTGGGFVTLWQANDGSESGVFAQRFNALGLPLGNPIGVNAGADTTGEQSFSESQSARQNVAALADGGFVVVYRSENSIAWNLMVQQYDSNGAPKGGPTTLKMVQSEGTADTTWLGGDATVAGLKGGGFVVVWMDRDIPTNSWEVYGQRFDANGAKSGGEIAVNLVKSNDQMLPHVTGLSDGGFVVTWRDQALPRGTGESNVLSQRFDAAGVSVGVVTQVNQTVTGNQWGGSTAPLGDGGYWSIWQSEGQDGSGWGVYAQRFGSSGNKIGPEIQVHTALAGNQWLPQLDTWSDGSFVAVWSDGDASIFARRFNAAGIPIGNPLKINQETLIKNVYPDVVALSDGSYTVSWRGTESANDTASGWKVYSKRVLEAGTVIGGDASDNLIYGTPSADSLNGYGGGDTLVGGLSPDVLIAGDGDDVIFAEATGIAGDYRMQADTIDGGAGRDTVIFDQGPLNEAYDQDSEIQGVEEIVISGQPSPGVYYFKTQTEPFVIRVNRLGAEVTGGDGADTIYGSLGADTLAGGYKAGNLIFGDGGDDLLIGADTLNGLGTAADSLFGESGKDSLFGLAGADFLSGGLGDDQLLGGLGADTLWGGQGNDWIDGGDGPTNSGDTLDVAYYPELHIGTDGRPTDFTITRSNEQVFINYVGSPAAASSGSDTLTAVELIALKTTTGSDTVVTIDSLLQGRVVGASVISGDSADNYLRGGIYADSLVGYGGADTLWGGEGADTLWGGIGNDLLDGGVGPFISGRGGDSVDVAYFPELSADTQPGGALTPNFTIRRSGSDLIIESIPLSLSGSDTLRDIEVIAFGDSVRSVSEWMSSFGVVEESSAFKVEISADRLSLIVKKELSSGSYDSSWGANGSVVIPASQFGLGSGFGYTSAAVTSFEGVAVVAAISNTVNVSGSTNGGVFVYRVTDGGAVTTGYQNTASNASGNPFSNISALFVDSRPSAPGGVVMTLVGGSAADIVLARLTGLFQLDSSFGNGGKSFFSHAVTTEGDYESVLGVARSSNGSIYILDRWGGNQNNIAVLGISSEGQIITSFGSSGWVDLKTYTETYPQGTIEISSTGGLVVRVSGKDVFTIDSTTGVYQAQLGVSIEPVGLPKIGGSVNEGTTLEFLIKNTGLPASSPVSYNIYGVSRADISNAPLAGTVLTNAQGDAKVTLQISADQLNEGAEAITVIALGQSATVSIADTSLGPFRTSSIFPQRNDRPPPWSNIEIAFSEPIQAGNTVDIQILTEQGVLVERITSITDWQWSINDGSKGLDGSAYLRGATQISSGSDVLVIDPATTLNAGTKYKVIVSSGTVKNLSGTANSAVELTFQTANPNAQFLQPGTFLGPPKAVAEELITAYCVPTGSDGIYKVVQVVTGHIGGDLALKILSRYGGQGIFVATSYNSEYRGSYAGIGYIYDAKKDVFRYAVDNRAKGLSETVNLSNYVSINGDTASVFFGSDEGNNVTAADIDSELIGGNAADSFSGGAGNDVLVGFEGDDVFNPGKGNDTVKGGLGKDKIKGGDGEGDDVYDGGEGSDQVIYTSALAPILVDLSKGIARSLGSQDANIGSDTLIDVEDIVGGPFADSIIGNPSDNFLMGMAGNDTLRGGEGSDTVGYVGNRAAYTVSIISQADSVYQISSTAEGSDVVSGVEWVQFADTVVSMASLVVGATPIKLYNLSAAADSVNEGATASFTLTTANVPAGEAVDYVITGESITAADLGGMSLTGTLLVGADGTAKLNLPIAADLLTEGNETLTVSAKGQTVSTAIVDTSKTPVPTYTVSVNADTVNEGATASFTLSTTNVAAGSKVPYAISGTAITSGDVVGGALSGAVTVDSTGRATISVPIAADRKTEGSEKLTVSAMGSSASVTVNDTSLTPQPVYRLTAAASTVNEGSVAVFNLSTENVDPGTVLSYTVVPNGNFDAADVVKGRMSGTVAVGKDGGATIRVPIRDDDTTELVAESITVTVQNQSASMTINDTSKEPVRLSTPPAVVGGTMTFTNASETGKTIFTGSVGASNAPVAISSGIVEVGAGGSLGTAPVSLGANATLAFGRSDDVAVANPISGAGGFKQSGTGKVVLASTNTYTGPTTVAAGTLVITGAIAGTGQVAVEEGATLGGTGSVAGPVAIGAGAGLAPGASPGAFAMNNGLTIAAGGTLYAELNGTVAGTEYDQLIVSGAVDITDAVLSVSVGFQSRPWDSFTIISNDGSDAVVGSFANLPEGAVFAAGSRFMKISYQGGTGNDVTLTDVPYCLVQGTAVLTPGGEVAVERLRRGDRIVTLQPDGSLGESEVRWLGVQRLRARAWMDPRLMPVCIRAGALGGGLPKRDLYLSPDHALLLQGHLIHAQALVNGQSIVQVQRWVGDVVYWHVETQGHDVMYAEGVPNETLIDAVSRRGFDNYAEYQALYPVEPMIIERRLPRVQFARQVPAAISGQLDHIAKALKAQPTPCQISPS